VEVFYSACHNLLPSALMRSIASLLPERTISCPISASRLGTFPSFVSCPAFLKKDFDRGRARHYAQCVSRCHPIRAITGIKAFLCISFNILRSRSVHKSAHSAAAYATVGANTPLYCRERAVPKSPRC